MSQVARSRRRFLHGLLAGGTLAGVGWPSRGMGARLESGVAIATPASLDLRIGESLLDFTGHTRPAITVNGQLPAPLLRWREGDTVTIRVHNDLPPESIHGHMTSIHWHGLLVPANMDGVPGMSFNGIHRGETYEYRFRLRQSGTYWYHSHSGFQEQAGLYGPIVIDPREPMDAPVQRDYVLLLSDWTDLDPARLFARLKKMPSYDNFSQRTVADFFRDAERMGLDATLADRRMWGRMRMTPTDLSDVNANTYTYLLNGSTSLGNWTGLFTPGERVRLRFINGSSMTHFDVRIPGLEMTVIAADGQPVHPVSVDEFRIAVAETFDVLVQPRGQEAFTIFAQDIGRTGWISGTLAVRDGLRAPIPPPDPRPLLGMREMGMAEGGCGANMAMPVAAGNCGAAMGMPGHSMANSPATPAAEGNCGASMTATATAAVSNDHAEMLPANDNPLVDMRAMVTAPHLDDPGIGLRDNGRRVLSYAMLRSRFDDPDGREPGREITLHLTGHMERYAWSFDGQKFADAAPLRLRYGERVRIVLVNDTMMTHPIHLHGMWSDLEDENGQFLVRKHTVDMPPGTRRSYRVRADALGRWAYHCHLLYHMEAGMMREVRVET